MAKKIPSSKFPTTKKKIPSRKFPKSKTKIPSRKFAKAPKAASEEPVAPVLPDRPANEEACHSPAKLGDTFGWSDSPLAPPRWMTMNRWTRTAGASYVRRVEIKQSAR